MRLGHRQSEDFDFFSTRSFNAKDLLSELPYLMNAVVGQLADNTLTFIVERLGRVQISFFGGLDLQRVHDPNTSAGNGVRVASLLDLAGCKAGTVQQRAVAKDYADIAAIIKAGVNLQTTLAAGRVVYGHRFDPGITLRALTTFDEGNLRQVDALTKKELLVAVSMVRLEEIPVLNGKPGVCE